MLRGFVIRGNEVGSNVNCPVHPVRKQLKTLDYPRLAPIVERASMIGAARK